MPGTGMRGRPKTEKQRPWQDSNLQYLVVHRQPEPRRTGQRVKSNALSIWPQGQWSKKEKEFKKGFCTSEETNIGGPEEKRPWLDSNLQELVFTNAPRANAVGIV